jgi:hypothetical protein
MGAVSLSTPALVGPLPQRTVSGLQHTILPFRELFQADREIFDRYCGPFPRAAHFSWPRRSVHARGRKFTPHNPGSDCRNPVFHRDERCS